MRRSIFAAEGALLSLCLLLTYCAEDLPEPSELPPLLSKIAFVMDGYQIYVMNADGTDQVNLTSNPASSDSWPSWSPDGTKIAFESWNKDEEFLEIRVMDADGVDRKPLTEGEQPSWSPDGKRIAFKLGQGNDGEIYVINTDGTNSKRLTNDKLRDEVPSWSPDGKKIAFMSDWGIYVMDADGTNKKRLVESGGTHPSWSPDGTKIAFMSNWPNHETYEIYVVNADGTNQVNLTNNPADDMAPCWSPDGKKIAFVSDRGGKVGLYGYSLYEIHVMNADGTDQKRLIDSSYSNTEPAWSPFLRAAPASW